MIEIGTLNEDYCKWCYADGTYTYSDMDELIDVCVGHMANENFSEEQARSYMKKLLPKRRWNSSGNTRYTAFTKVFFLFVSGYDCSRNMDYHSDCNIRDYREKIQSKVNNNIKYPVRF